jgi:hypothetical protein
VNLTLTSHQRPGAGRRWPTRLIAPVFLSVALIFGAHSPHLQAETAAGQRWFVQTVDNDGNVGSWSSLALYHGQPHVAYTDDTLSALHYAYRDNSGWHTEVVDSWGYVGLLPSIGVDSNGRPHIAYFGTTEQKLKYWRRWSIHFPGTGRSRQQLHQLLSACILSRIETCMVQT